MAKNGKIGSGMVTTLRQLSTIDKEKLPIQERPIFPREGFFSQDENPIVVGSIIVRPMTVMNSDRRVFTDIVFDKAESKKKKISSVFKAYQSAHYFTDNWVAQSVNSKGITCFCEQDVPNDWACFEVVAKSKNGKAIFVKPIAGGLDEAAKHYRLDEVHLPKHSGVISASS